MFDLFGFGHCCADYLSLLKPYPAKGKKGDVVESLTIGGGPVPTACQMVASLGKRVSFCGKVGNDTDGALVLDGLRESNVDSTRMIIDPAVKTARASIWIDPEDGARTVALDTFRFQFPNEVEFDRDWVKECRFFLVDGRAAEATVAALKEARRLGVPTMLDAGAVRPSMSLMIPLLDYTVVSSDFADTYAPGASAPELANLLLGAGTGLAVVTVGERVAYWQSGNEGGFVEGFSVTDVIDTTGAGDIFHGGLIYGILEGWDIRRSIRFANAAAALSTRRLSGRLSIPERREIDAMLKEVQ